MIFKINKGDHYSNRFIYKIFNFFNFNRRVKYGVTFNDTAIYLDETIDKYDINKIFGLSNGNHLKNSYRFGWNIVNGGVFLYLYLHIDGKIEIKPIGKIGLKKQYELSIILNKDNVIFMVSDNKTVIFRDLVIIKPLEKISYNLFPYFGGNKVAPHDIFIKFSKI